jgi:bacterioferritin-associated ferredoxin
MKEAGVASVEEAGERFGAGIKCGLCLPYLKKMLETGDVSFSLVLEADCSSST